MLDPRLLIVGGAIVGAALMQPALGETNADRLRDGLHYTPDPELAGLLSFGHRSTFADTLWLRSLPDISREFNDAEEKERWLAGVLDTVTELEPTFSTVYDYGANYLALLDRRIRPQAPHAARAVQPITIVQKGISSFERLESEDQQAYAGLSTLLRTLALIHHLDRKDEERALAYLDRCVERPDCDLLTRGMWSTMKSERGGQFVALVHWAELAEHANPDIAFHGRLQYARTRQMMARRAWTAFESSAGRPPATIAELRAAGHLDDDVATLVFEDMEIRDGSLFLASLADLERDAWRRTADEAMHHYRRDKGAWPTLDWVLDPENVFLIGRGHPFAPPAGTVWEIIGGRLVATPNE